MITISGSSTGLHGEGVRDLTVFLGEVGGDLDLYKNTNKKVNKRTFLSIKYCILYLCNLNYYT